MDSRDLLPTIEVKINFSLGFDNTDFQSGCNALLLIIGVKINVSSDFDNADYQTNKL